VSGGGGRLASGAVSVWEGGWHRQRHLCVTLDSWRGEDKGKRKEKGWCPNPCRFVG
jgi:hypothetical protein